MDFFLPALKMAHKIFISNHKKREKKRKESEMEYSEMGTFQEAPSLSRGARYHIRRVPPASAEN